MPLEFWFRVIMCSRAYLSHKVKGPPSLLSFPPTSATVQKVSSLLADIAHDKPDFEGFTPEQVRHVLLASGYLRLEFVRAKMRMPDMGHGEVA